MTKKALSRVLYDVTGIRTAYGWTVYAHQQHCPVFRLRKSTQCRMPNCRVVYRPIYGSCIITSELKCLPNAIAPTHACKTRTDKTADIWARYLQRW
jgi:hypothetical protein